MATTKEKFVLAAKAVVDEAHKVEYSKSGRAGCKGCKKPISKGSMRMSVFVKSPFFDGVVPNHYHWQCYIKKRKKGGHEFLL